MSDGRAVVFDTDGVLPATAVRHASAWKQAFDGCLARWHPTHAGRQLFLEAVGRLGSAPARAAVVEDALGQTAALEASRP
ncbi:hypothetical protein ACIGFK_16235 [Streptomyces sp. NPDC085524]|uniref:hypothetical protein n=1 Tax=unclassified Streptomyces TaxID=2593676 RepID=UPI0035E149FC